MSEEMASAIDENILVVTGKVKNIIFIFKKIGFERNASWVIYV